MKYHGAAMSGDAEREEGPAMRYGGCHACHGIALGLACVCGGVDAPFMWDRILRVNVGAASDRAAVPPAWLPKDDFRHVVVRNTSKDVRGVRFDQTRTE